ncbi:MAG: DNA repair protein RecO [Thermoguttaceae bacterium]
MSSEKATAIVLRTIDFSESSLIVTLFTREFGKIGALAKGAKRLKSPFDSALDLLALCRIVFLRKSSEALDLLTEAKLLRRFRVSGPGLERLYAGYYVAELLMELTDQYDPNVDLFDLAEETLTALSGGEDARKRLLHFELRALRELGHLPALECCAECAKPIAMTGRISFGLLDGGVLCPQCRQHKRQVASVSAGALRIMAQYAGDDNRWQRVEIDRRNHGEIRGLLNHFICHLLGHKPRLHAFLGRLEAT